MKSIRNRFNLDSDVWNNRENTNDGNQRAKDLLFPYLKEIKSAIELILLTLEILMILLLMTIQAGIIIIGPM